MAGAIEKKKNETYDELVGSPTTHIDARSQILSDIALSREFSHVYLNALCQKFTSSSGNYSLHQICESLAQQRAICYGARDIKTGFKKFNLPSYETVNGALTLTEANTSFFGYVATTLDEKTTITLSNTTTANQTIDGNTFSTYIGNYYLVRSRVSGELEPTSANLSAYTTPDGADIVFGNAVAWATNSASNIPSSEQAANTWNYHWARANVASVAVKNSGGVLELNTLTLADHLTAGSNTDYTPVGPGFNDTFYLKRHTDSVNTFTITGTTSINSVSITGVSEADMAKVKHGDVIGGTGIPDNNVTVLAVQTEKNAIRLSESGVATADGTVTLTVNSVPVGHAAHDIFCQVKVSAEGLVANTTWTPVGDNAGNYASGSEDDLCVADTDAFKALLSFFNPDSPNNDLTKGASANYTSDGKEYNGTQYPDIEINPFFPSNAGTTKEYTVKNGEITGTQPATLGNKDVWSGRFVRFDKERANAAGALPEFRYLIDNAEKFYYELPSTAGYTCGTGTVAAFSAMPSGTEPPIVINKAGLSGAITRIKGTSVTIGSTTITSSATGTVPADTATIEPALTGLVSGGNQPSAGATIGTYYTLAQNYIWANRYHYETVTVSSGNWTATVDTDTTPFVCFYNFAQKHIYENNGTANNSMNADVQFIRSTVDDLQSIDGFRDPITTGAAAGGSGISDSAFDSYIASEPDADLAALSTALKSFRDSFSGQNRSTNNHNSPQTLGSPITFATTTWDNFSSELTTFGSNCGKRVAEIDARIGLPTRTGGGVLAGNPPTGRISAIPSSPATGEFRPYGRAIYNNVNHLLGQDINLLGSIIKDIESLSDLVDMVKTARNKYEIYSGRDKVAGY